MAKLPEAPRDPIPDRFPGWEVQFRERMDVPWRAERVRPAMWRGGITSIEATTADLLRVLLMEVARIDDEFGGRS